MHPDIGDNATLIVGPKPVAEYVRDHPERVDMVFAARGGRPGRENLPRLCKEAGVRFRLVEQAFLDKLVPGNHKGAAARVFTPGFADLEHVAESAATSSLRVILALDQVQDPGNAGTLARTLLGLGGAGLVVPRDRSSYLGGGAMRASAGALQRLAAAQVVNLARSLDELRSNGFAVYCAGKSESSVSAYATVFRFPCVLVLGSEEKGVRPNVARRCDQEVHIPMPGPMESFNVAQAGAILLGEMFRQAQGTPQKRP